MIRVLLQPYRVEFYLPEDFIRTALQGSLLDQALQEDSDATEIPIPNPDVTPEAMQFLVDYSQGKEPEKHLPSLILAERYLNIPWMLYYVDPMYDQIPDRANIKDPANQDILALAIGTNHDLIVGYFIAKGWKPTPDDLLQAYEASAWKVIRVLLMAGVDIELRVKTSLLDGAAGDGELEVIKLLMRDPKLNPTEPAGANYPLRLASENGHHAVMRQLLTDPRVDPNVVIQDHHHDRYDEEALRILANDPRTDSDSKETVLYYAAYHGYTPLVQELLEQGIEPDSDLDDLQAARDSGNPETLALFMAIPKIQAELKRLDEEFYRWQPTTIPQGLVRTISPPRRI
jgi:ankyrin repeat protein